MVTQYPHFLYFKQLGGESAQGADGNWSTSEPTWKLHSKCREETNGKGTQINGVDGKTVVYSSMIYMPKGVAKITEGTEVLISESETESVVGSEKGPVRIIGVCLKFDPSQLNCRLWV